MASSTAEKDRESEHEEENDEAALLDELEPNADTGRENHEEYLNTLKHHLAIDTI